MRACLVKGFTVIASLLKLPLKARPVLADPRKRPSGCWSGTSHSAAAVRGYWQASSVMWQLVANPRLLHSC
jgi:hypothetical protein